MSRVPDPGRGFVIEEGLVLHQGITSEMTGKAGRWIREAGPAKDVRVTFMVVCHSLTLSGKYDVHAPYVLIGMEVGVGRQGVSCSAEGRWSG